MAKTEVLLDTGPLVALLSKRDQPVSFADACLVCMVEERRQPQVFTTDDDFHVYRTNDGEALDVLAPGTG